MPLATQSTKVALAMVMTFVGSQVRAQSASSADAEIAALKKQLRLMEEKLDRLQKQTTANTVAAAKANAKANVKLSAVDANPVVRANGDRDQREHIQRQQADDQLATVQHVAERHDREQRARVAELRRRHQKAQARRRAVEGLRDGDQQGLRVVDVAADGAARAGEQQRHLARERRVLGRGWYRDVV